MELFRNILQGLHGNSSLTEVDADDDVDDSSKLSQEQKQLWNTWSTFVTARKNFELDIAAKNESAVNEGDQAGTVPVILPGLWPHVLGNCWTRYGYKYPY